jgi:membrane fusion protein, copper/silver efflux system
MRKSLNLIYVLLLVAGSFVAGTWYSKHSADAGVAAASRKILRYYCPMHPEYTSDKPGAAPCCGMQLEPVYADEAGSNAGAHRDQPTVPGSVMISAERQQMIGVKVMTAERGAANKSIRIPGRVVPDETRLFRINAAVDGWVKTIAPITTGSVVRKNDLLAGIYAPESASAMKAYLYGLRSMDKVRANVKESKEQLELSDSTLDNFRNSLRNLGMGEYQLDEIQRTREGTSLIDIRATESGFILARNITPGQRFERGTELFQIADLSRVWVLADVFGREAYEFKPGMKVRVSMPDYDASFQARVSDILPQFDPATRTLKVRIETENPKFLLRPEMFVDVEAPCTSEAAILVPADAVINTGRKQTVFIEHGNGYFEPREVATGGRFGDQILIREGISEGEQIVVSGTFLIDSESRMKAVTANVNEDLVIDPLCGMSVDMNKAKALRRTAEYAGRTYYFCSDDCRQKFARNPELYLRKKGQPEAQPKILGVALNGAAAR